ncbi:hypothetical protein MLD38_001973 [Melastoma candidum]|uniref:Uncharacterized protein n=1 Tax=Melastoma candidum TaxID=119954 RepID=A0ACB9SF29_9MYRT|nr:hypothetical protein MLD38_001973 [Melastoma candidum]
MSLLVTYFLLTVMRLLSREQRRHSYAWTYGRNFDHCGKASYAAVCFPRLTKYLRTRNWNVKKATKMLKETLKWRSNYKPEEIRWEDIAHEAETGKIYRTDYIDKHGRTALVMRPSRLNSKSTKGQINYLVYCMENAILNLPPDQEQMVWLIDFEGFNLTHISVKLSKETAHVLQDHYPERLGAAILHNPPKFFEPFFMVVKPFLEPKTYNKVKFVYSDDLTSQKIMNGGTVRHRPARTCIRRKGHGCWIRDYQDPGQRHCQNNLLTIFEASDELKLLQLK